MIMILLEANVLIQLPWWIIINISENLSTVVVN